MLRRLGIAGGLGRPLARSLQPCARLNGPMCRFASTTPALPEKPLQLEMRMDLKAPSGSLPDQSKYESLLEDNPELYRNVAEYVSEHPSQPIYITKGSEFGFQPSWPNELTSGLRNLFQQYPSLRSLQIGKDLSSEAAIRNAVNNTPVIPSGESLNEILKLSCQWRPAKIAGGWDDPQRRRNYGEPMHEQSDILGMHAPNIRLPPRMAYIDSLKAQVVMVAVFCGFFALFSLSLPEPPAIPKQYPYNGLKEELGGQDRLRALPQEEKEFS